MVFRLLGYALLLPRVYHGPAARSSTPKDGNFAYVARARLPTWRRSGAPDCAGGGWSRAAEAAGLFYAVDEGTAGHTEGAFQSTQTTGFLVGGQDFCFPFGRIGGTTGSGIAREPPAQIRIRA